MTGHASHVGEMAGRMDLRPRSRFGGATIRAPAWLPARRGSEEQEAEVALRHGGLLQDRDPDRAAGVAAVGVEEEVAGLVVVDEAVGGASPSCR